MNTFKTICITFLTLVCVLFAGSAYAQDLDVTMDVVQDPQEKEITESMTNKIEMPAPGKQKSKEQKDKERDNGDQGSKNMRQQAGERQDRAQSAHKMREQKNNARENKNRVRKDQNRPSKDRPNRPDRDTEPKPDNGAHKPDVDKQRDGGRNPQ